MKQKKVLVVRRIRKEKTKWIAELDGQPSVYGTGHSKFQAIADAMVRNMDFFKVTYKIGDPV
jgi:hypothetical protein